VRRIAYLNAKPTADDTLAFTAAFVAEKES
jgi:hypothetical protein